MRILMTTAELWPLAKVGGLADMVGSLARALVEAGHDVRCALPAYGGMMERLPAGSREVSRVTVTLDLGGVRQTVEAVRHAGPGLPGTVVLLAHAAFDRPGIYADPETGEAWDDGGRRWALYGRAVDALADLDGWIPDVVHAHDHQASLTLGLIRWGLRWAPPRPRPAAVFTIHNLGYQGIEEPEWVALTGLPGELAATGGPLEFHGRVNLMKLGIVAADRLTTVSPRYATEIRSGEEFGFGLEGLLESRADRLHGILNGIDVDVWDPSADPHLPWRFSAAAMENKAKVGAALRAELGLASPSRPSPLVGMVGRLASQKGIDLLLPVLDTILEENIQMAVLGSGDRRYESALLDAAARHRGRLAFRGGHDEALAHRIEAGSDMFLMPSRYEPCGLNQMYSLRYGTVPLVRAVGGLADTVVDLDEDPERANGFVFRAWEPVEVLKTVRRAVRAWREPGLWATLVRRGMEADFSWARSALAYQEVYEAARRDASGTAAMAESRRT